jgi:intracellular sulfur oxidation DsrE/DsrF family protein
MTSLIRRAIAVGSLTLIATVAGAQEPSDNWLKGINSKHKQLFDAPAPDRGIPLVHVMNYYDTYNKAYKVSDADIDAVLTFYGATTFYGLNDAAWNKYKLGEFMDTKDATGQFVTANPWRSAPNILGMSLPQASIEALQKRGATMILCNNALSIFAGMVAAKRGLDANAVYTDMKASMLPGVHLVPAMVIAIEQGQRAGLAYHRQ